MSTVSTHVLDAALGLPAAGLGVTLLRHGELVEVVEESVTDADGRIRFTGEVQPGVHTVAFATGPWFAAAGRDTFYPEVTVTVEIADDRHHHVALLLSPYAYTTYRGS